jgi:hypothetical protein
MENVMCIVHVYMPWYTHDEAKGGRIISLPFSCVSMGVGLFVVGYKRHGFELSIRSNFVCCNLLLNLSVRVGVHDMGGAFSSFSY